VLLRVGAFYSNHRVDVVAVELGRLENFYSYLKILRLSRAFFVRFALELGNAIGFIAVRRIIRFS
jgi:hypothetical protein